MTELLIGSLLISILHPLFPNHWMPLVAIGKAQGWDRSEAMFFTGVVALAHASSTVLLGIAVGLLGYGFSAHPFVTAFLPPIVLVGLGIVYIVIDIRAEGKGHHHVHHHQHWSETASNLSLIGTLSLGMFFSPCLEIEAFYVKAGLLGLDAILALSLVYLVTTVLGMVLFVDLALRGAKRVHFPILERHEHRVTGFVLVGLGFVSAFISIVH